MLDERAGVRHKRKADEDPPVVTIYSVVRMTVIALRLARPMKGP